MMTSIPESIKQVQQRLQHAAIQAGRKPEEIRLLAVSKTRPAGDIEAARAAGLRHFGENYLQEALGKITELHDCGCIWHFIGRIQSNKTRPIAENFDWVHTLESSKQAQRLNHQRPDDLPPLNVCLQINIDREENKAGLAPESLSTFIDEIKNLENLNIRGLMAIPKASNDRSQQHRAFREMRLLMQEANNRHGLDMDTLSMGMSGDMEAAIEEGSTLVRIGTAIFGKRHPKTAAP